MFLPKSIQGYTLVLGLFISSAAPVQAETFDGLYAGVQAGWAKRSGRSAVLPAGLGNEASKSSAEYGSFAGFNYAASSGLMMGVEVEMGSGGKTLNNRENNLVIGTLDPRWNYSLSARLGGLIGTNLLIYGRSGFGAERIKSTFEGAFIQVVPGPETRRTEWTGGLLVGGGIEYLLSESLSARVEYRYRDMENGYKSENFLAGFAVHF